MNENEITNKLIHSIDKSLKSAEKVYASLTNHPKNGKELKKEYYLFSEKIIACIKDIDELCLIISDSICAADKNNRTDAISTYDKYFDLTVNIGKVLKKYLTDIEDVIEHDNFDISTFIRFTNILIRKLTTCKNHLLTHTIT